MAEKQRRRPPAAAQRGVFTRSRSEIFLRRTRSGLLRADLRDGRRRRNPISALSAYSSDENRCANTGIKDLRLRRVFSPANIAVESSPYQKDEGDSCEDRTDLTNELMEEKIHEESGGVGVDEGPFKSVCGSRNAMECSHPVHVNNTDVDEESVDRTEMLGLCDEQPAAPAAQATYPTTDVGFGEMPNESDESKDEQMQCTPTDCLNSAEMEEDRIDRAKMTDLCNDRAASMTPMTTETSFPPKSRLGVKLCPRSKLFRNPSSFSYRRLLPFFMDLVKDNSNDVQVLRCQSSPQKVKKPSEEISTSSNSLGGKELPPRGCTEEELRESLNVDASNMEESSSKVIEYSTSGSPIKCFNNEVHVDTLLVNELNRARALDLIEVKSDPSNEDLDLVPDLLCKSSHSASNVSEALPVEELAGKSSHSASNVSEALPVEELAGKSSHSASNVSEALPVEELAGNVHCISCLPIRDERPGSSVIHALEIEKPRPRTSEIVPVYSMTESAFSPRKGILKKKTRGCKGICMCLDCVSFRIHADQAYEFSRKQMIEADEIIEGLVKELRVLRSLVEKSTPTTTEGGSSHMIFQLNQELLKGACCRASRAEEVANKRRREMFNDLNAHCRIPGPRVTFAESIDETQN